MIKINENFYVKSYPNYFLLLKKKDKKDVEEEAIDDDVDEEFSKSEARQYVKCGYYGTLKDLFKALPDKFIICDEKNRHNLVDIQNFLKIYEEYTRMLTDMYKSLQVMERLDGYRLLNEDIKHEDAE